MSYYDRYAYLPTSHQLHSQSPTRRNNHSRLQHEVVDDVFMDYPSTENTPIILPRDSSINLLSIINKFEALDALNSPSREEHEGSLMPQPLRKVTRNKIRNNEGTQIKYAMGLSLRIKSLSRMPVFDGNSASKMSDAQHFSNSSMGKIPTSGRNTTGFSSMGRAVSRTILQRNNQPSVPVQPASQTMMSKLAPTSAHPTDKRMTVREMIGRFDNGKFIMHVVSPLLTFESPKPSPTCRTRHT
jgi:hypothetical protein